MRFFFFLLSFTYCFDSLASIHDQDLLDQYEGLEKLSWKKPLQQEDGSIVEIDVPLVKQYKKKEPYDRKSELAKCYYLTGQQLYEDWERYKRGDRSWKKYTRYILWDVEVNNTTFEGEIIQISGIEVINGCPSGLVFETLVKPTTTVFSKYAQGVHKITLEDLQEAPKFKEISEQMLRFMGGSLFMAHNAAFDVRMVSQEFERIDVTIPFTLFYKCSYQMDRRRQKRHMQTGNIFSPMKQKPVSHIPIAEREKMIREKRAKREATKKRREENKRKKASKASSSSSSSDSETPLSVSSSGVSVADENTPPSNQQPTSSSLGHYVRELKLTYPVVKQILGLESPHKSGTSRKRVRSPDHGPNKKARRGNARDIGHHNAVFDTLATCVVMSIGEQEVLEQEIHFSQASSSSSAFVSPSSDDDSDSAFLLDDGEGGSSLFDDADDADEDDSGDLLFNPFDGFQERIVPVQ